MPTETAETETSETLKDFGNLDEVFNKVFPATAEKKEGDALRDPSGTQTTQPTGTPSSSGAVTSEPETAPPPAEPEKPKEEVKPPTDDLPDFLTGKTETTPEPEKHKEEEIPPPRANESMGMKQLRSAYENLKRSSQEKETQFTTQIEELKKRPEVPPDLEAKLKQVETERDKYREAVERGAIEFSPYVQEKYTKPRENLINLAHSTLKEAGIDPAQWDAAMAKSGPAKIEALEELYEAMPKSVANELGPIATGIRNLDLQKQMELADRKGMVQKVQEQQLIQQREMFQQREKQTLQNLEVARKEMIEQHGFAILQKSDKPEHQKWNGTVDTIDTNARKILLEVDDEKILSKAAYAAASAPVLLNLYQIMRDRWQEAERKLKAIENAEPDTTTHGEKPESDEKLTFAEAVTKGVYSH